jgi:pimeloyl-ACP methyl ester carboxylesterase
MSKARKCPPVLMIHGGFCGPWSVQGFAGRFEAAGYPVLCPALRFHDMAEPPHALGTTSLVDYVADLEQALEEWDAPAILVGHAMGGLLAQLLAARRKVRAAVLLAPSAPWGVPPASLAEIAAAQTLLLKVGFWNRVLMPDSDVPVRHSLDRFPPAERDGMLRRLGPESGRAIFEIMHWGLDMARASEVETAKCACPFLLLSGSEDRLNPPATVERIAALYGERARYEKIPGMGHWLHAEPGWEAIADKALAWLEKL